MGKDLNGKELGKCISQRKNGSYTARFINRFGERKSLYDMNIRELKRKYSEEMAKNELGQNVKNSVLTLNEWHKTWMKIHKVGISEGTKCIYNNVWNKYIKNQLGAYKLNEISNVMIRKAIIDCPVGFDTKSKIKILLVDMFDKAIIDDFVYKNPARGIKIERDDMIEPKVLTVDEQKIFFECAKGTFYYPFFLFAVSTGLRCGEIAALTRDDVDLKNKTIRVSKTLAYQKYEGDDKKEFHFCAPKTKTSYRSIPMNSQSINAFNMQCKVYKVTRNRLKNSRLEEGFDEFVFTTTYGTPICPQNIIDAVKKIVAEINYSRDVFDEMESFSCHTFRHTFATRCFESGISPKTVQKYLGHATLQMTMDLYTHVLETTKIEEMKKLENKLSECLQEEEDNKIIRFIS